MINQWTQNEIEFLQKNYLNKSDKEISQLLGTHPPSSVKDKRQTLGLEKDKTHRKYNFDDVIQAFNTKGYILLSSSSDYKNAAENNLRYICPKHQHKGEQKISLGHILDGRGCYYCGRKITEDAHKIPNQTLNKECKRICESKGFIYCGVERKRKSNSTKQYIKYICPHHQNAGIQLMQRHNMERENIVGCPYCVETKKYKFSKGEQRIEQFLKEHNIAYLRQYVFKDCKDQKYLPFDFYLTDFNICIEYDGQHHYHPVTFNGISQNEAYLNYLSTKKHDELKNQYCEKHNITLLRIPYFDYQNINQILGDFLLKERNNIA